MYEPIAFEEVRFFDRFSDETFPVFFLEQKLKRDVSNRHQI